MLKHEKQTGRFYLVAMFIDSVFCIFMLRLKHVSLAEIGLTC